MNSDQYKHMLIIMKCSLFRCTLPNPQEEKHRLEQSGSGSGSEQHSGRATESNVTVKCRRCEQSETDRLNPYDEQRSHMLIEEEMDEYDDEEEEGEEEEDTRAPRGKRGLPTVTLREGAGKRRCNRPHSLDLGVLLTHKATGDSRAQVKQSFIGFRFV